jgi:hypothetical protein
VESREEQKQEIIAQVSTKLVLYFPGWPSHIEPFHGTRKDELNRRENQLAMQ